MKIWKRVLCIICVLDCCLCGCAKKQENYLREGLYCNVPNVPRIEEFSGEAYEEYEHHFPPVESAVYVYNGTEIAIEPDDPRLIRLLNFLAYADNERSYWILQGCVDEANIKSTLVSNAPRLEVDFFFPESLNKRWGTKEDTPKIIICGDLCLMYCREPDPDGTERIVKWWPYADLYVDCVGVENSRLSQLGWETKLWIDFLVYAGFTKPSESAVG